MPVQTADPSIACPKLNGESLVKDARTAIAEAKAAWNSTFEKNPHGGIGSPAHIEKLEPYSATLRDGVWHVEGTVPPEYHGHAPVASVCESDGRVSTNWVDVP